MPETKPVQWIKINLSSFDRLPVAIPETAVCHVRKLAIAESCCFYNQAAASWCDGPKTNTETTVKWVMEHFGRNEGCEAWIESEVLFPASDGEKRIIPIEYQIPKESLDLIRAAPLNPVSRGILLKYVKKPCPDSCKTFANVKNWVEENGNNINLQASSAEANTLQQMNPAPAPPPARARPAVAFSIDVLYSETESGSATYDCTNSGSGPVEITEEYLLRIANRTAERGNGMDAVMEALAGDMEELAREQLSFEAEDYEYNNHESSDATDQNADYSSTALRERVGAYLLENHPNLYETLTAND
jgi:hypothetical protein